MRESSRAKSEERSLEMLCTLTHAFTQFFTKSSPTLMNSKYLVATAAKPSLGHSCGGSGNRGCFGVVVVMISVVIVMRCGCGACCSGEKVKILFSV